MPPPAVEVKIEREAIKRLLADLDAVKNGAPRAVSTAIVSSIRTIRTRIVRAVAQDLNVPQAKLYQRGNTSRIRRPIREVIRRDAGKAVAGTVRVSGGRLPITEDRFSPRQHWRKARRATTVGAVTVKKGGRVRAAVSFKIRKGAGRTRVTKGLFMATMPGGFSAVWRNLGGRRLALAYGPSVPYVASKRPDVRRLLATDAEQVFFRNVASQVDRLLERARSKRTS